MRFYRPLCLRNEEKVVTLYHFCCIFFLFLAIIVLKLKYTKARIQIFIVCKKSQSVTRDVYRLFEFGVSYSVIVIYITKIYKQHEQLKIKCSRILYKSLINQSQYISFTIEWKITCSVTNWLRDFRKLFNSYFHYENKKLFE